MFFMGMTIGYLQPPVRAKRPQAAAASPAEKGAATTPARKRTIAERPLLWAWRVLC